MAMPPKAEDVAAMEESNARATLQEFPKAAGAYDRMPFASAAAVWTLDTSTDIFLLHSFQVCYAALPVFASKLERKGSTQALGLLSCSLVGGRSEYSQHGEVCA